MRTLSSLLLCAALAGAFLAPHPSGDALAKKPAASARQSAFSHPNVYQGQKEFDEKELVKLASFLPGYRSWIRQNAESAHPAVVKGQADFVYSQKLSSWLQENGWDPVRFFCVMGRTAAAMALVDGGPDAKVFKDMPSVSETEKSLVQKHLGELLKAGGEGAPSSK